MNVVIDGILQLIKAPLSVLRTTKYFKHNNTKPITASITNEEQHNIITLWSKHAFKERTIYISVNAFNYQYSNNKLLLFFLSYVQFTS